MLTAEQALAQLLRGTSLTFRFTAPFAAVVEIRIASESVEVSGRAPRASSPKFTEPLRNTPQTITVIPQALMEAQSATTLRDVLRNVPGITIQAGEGGTPAGDQMAIRGFSARTDIFIDGVRDFGGYSRDSFNLEQVEVTKGPASATSGRGSTGGSVNMVSKAPSLGAAARSRPAAATRTTSAARWTSISRSAESAARPPAERDVAGRRHAGPRRRRKQPLGPGAVDRLRPRHADAAHGQLLPAGAGRHSRLRRALGAGDERPARRATRTRRRPWTSATSTACATATTRRRRRISGRWSSSHDVGRG